MTRSESADGDLRGQESPRACQRGEEGEDGGGVHEDARDADASPLGPREAGDGLAARRLRLGC